MHYVYTTADRLNLEVGTSLPEGVDCRLSYALHEGADAYTVDILQEAGWVSTNTVVHLNNQQLYEEEHAGILNSICGLEELASKLGLDKRVVSVLMKRGQMVKPFKDLACGPLFLQSDIDEWMSKNKKGREKYKKGTPDERQ